MEFPIFDLSKFRNAELSEQQSLARQVDEICCSTGFLAIGNHGIEKSVIENVWREAVQFFDLPFDEKQKAKVLEPGYPYGYMSTGTEALAKSKGVDTPPDFKESFNGGPQEIPDGISDSDALKFCYAKTPWPERAEFKAAWIAYYQAVEKMAGEIMQVFALALNLPKHFFDDYIDAPISALRALNYPAIEGELDEGQQRAGAHTDYGSLTILLPQAGSKGLEIEGRDGQWHSVPALPDVFVINIGDLMARWTNDRWVSTLHRVVQAPNQGRRQSLAFFHQPNWFAKIECLETCLEGKAKYDPVLSGPYLMEKFKSTV